MVQFKVAVCDDDESIQSFVELAVTEYAKNNGILVNIDSFRSGEEICRSLAEGYFPDLLFQDIKMKHMSGIKVGEYIRFKLKNNLVQIVYVSSYDEYVKQLFAIRPMNFLEKPLTKAMVEAQLKTALGLFNINHCTFTYTKNRDVFKVPIKDILYFQGENREVIMHTCKGMIRFYSSLKKVNEQIEQFDFFYCHKSYLVSYYRVIRFGHDELELEDKTRLPISSRKRAEVNQFRIDKEVRKGERV